MSGKNRTFAEFNQKNTIIMARIRFISPVEALQGNMSGKQKLVYPTSDNKAWESPDGKQFARNYTPRFIGAMRAASGKTYFAVKARSAVNMTESVRRQQAITSVALLYANAVTTDAAGFTAAMAIWRDHIAAGYNRYTTLRGFLNAMLQEGIAAKDRVISVGVQGVSETRLSVTNVYNWYSSTTGDITPTISRVLMAKFFPYIGVSSDDSLPVGFGSINVKGNPFAFVDGQNFGYVVDGSDEVVAAFNTSLNFSSDTVGTNDYVKVGNDWLMTKAGVYVKVSDMPQAVVYITKSVAPTE